MCSMLLMTFGGVDVFNGVSNLECTESVWCCLCPFILRMCLVLLIFFNVVNVIGVVASL